jgi:putative peptidoglycan lipid II flippase
LSTKYKLNQSDKSAYLAESAGSVSIAVFFSRILGLIREQVLAGLFGAGTAMDAFVVAFRIPNLLRDLFAEGALSSAFVTVFAEYDQKRSREETWRLANNVLSVLTIIVSLIVILGMVFSNELVMLLAPDFAKVAGKVELTQHLTIIMFPFLLLISISSLFMGILNTRGHFFIPSFASTCFNITSIIVGVGLALLFPLWGYPAIMGMAIGTLLGGLSQMIIQLPLILRHGFKIKPLIDFTDPGLKRIGKLIVPAIIGLSATQINIFVNTNFASRCAEGSVAWLNYAFRLVQFPIGLFGVAVSIATLPIVARLATKENYKVLGDTLVSSLILTFSLTIPAAVGLWIMAEPIIGLIFEHGQFSSSDTLMTAQALRFYSVGLLAYAAVKIIVPVFYALNETRWPVIGSFIAVAFNIFIILATLDKLQHKAIALSTSVTMIFNFVLLAVILYKKIGGYSTGRIFMSLSKIITASSIMGVLVWWAQMSITGYTATWFLAVKVFISVSLGIFCYSVVAYMLRLTEFNEIIKKVTGWFKS